MLNWFIRGFVRAGCSLAEASRLYPRLDRDSIFKAAAKRSNRQVLDDPLAEEPLARMLDSYINDVEMNSIGRIALSSRMSDLLCMRAWLRDREERGELVPVESTAPPLIVTGFPRTGTTFSHRLLACAPDARWPELCETIFPVLPPEIPIHKARKKRLRRVQFGERIVRACAPGLRSIHELVPDGPEECTALHEMALDSESIGLVGECRAYRDWIESRDSARRQERYRMQEMCFRSIIADRPEDKRHGRWVLKAPQHLLGLDELFEQYPDAKVVRMHRDPVDAMASLASLVATTAKIVTRGINLEVGDDLLETFIDWQIAGDEACERYPDSILEVRYVDLVRDPVGFVRRVHDFSGIPCTEQHIAAVEKHCASRPRHHFGAHTYRLDTYGLDTTTVRTQTEQYCQRIDALPGW